MGSTGEGRKKRRVRVGLSGPRRALPGVAMAAGPWRGCGRHLRAGGVACVHVPQRLREGNLILEDLVEKVIRRSGPPFGAEPACVQLREAHLSTLELKGHERAGA
jgi:hypothetical protein